MLPEKPSQHQEVMLTVTDQTLVQSAITIHLVMALTVHQAVYQMKKVGFFILINQEHIPLECE